jgi:hypothetical protein
MTIVQGLRSQSGRIAIINVVVALMIPLAGCNDRGSQAEKNAASPELENTSKATIAATPEVKSLLEKAATAEDIGSYESAAEYIGKVLEKDDSQIELLLRMADCYGNAKQPLKRMASAQAYLSLRPSSANSGSASRVISEIKAGAETAYESLLTEARNAWAKLPAGRDHSVRAAGLPRQVELEYERLTEEFKQNYMTKFAIFEALVSRPSSKDIIHTYWGRLDAGTWVERPDVSEPITSRIERLLRVNDFESAREIGRWGLNGIGADGLSRNIEQQVSEVAQKLEAVREKLGPLVYRYDENTAKKYWETVDVVWSDHIKSHPLKPATLQDWLRFIVETGDPLEGEYKLRLDELRADPKNAAKKLAQKAQKIGEFLFEMELLDRRARRK